MTGEQVVYCIENQEEGLDYGKHNFILNEELKTFGCEFCFLPKEKANLKPLIKRWKGNDGEIWLDHNCATVPCPHGKFIFVKQETQQIKNDVTTSCHSYWARDSLPSMIKEVKEQIQNANDEEKPILEKYLNSLEELRKTSETIGERSFTFQDTEVPLS